MFSKILFFPNYTRYIHPLAWKKVQKRLLYIFFQVLTHNQSKKKKGFNLHCKQHEKYPYDKVEKLSEMSWVFSNGDKMKTFHISIRNLDFPLVSFSIVLLRQVSYVYSCWMTGTVTWDRLYPGVICSLYSHTKRFP